MVLEISDTYKAVTVVVVIEGEEEVEENVTAGTNQKKNQRVFAGYKSHCDLRGNPLLRVPCDASQPSH